MRCVTPRPRLSSDTDVLAAASRVILRVGPSRLTLSDISQESGLAPATLLQRFGSKRGLLLAVARSAAESADACFVSVRAAHSSPLKAVLASFEEVTCSVDTPESVANSLAFLQIDLADPEFRALADRSGHSIVRGYQELLNEAVNAGELARCDTARLARALWSTCHGSMLSWAIHREGSLSEWVRTDLETVLSPYLLLKPGAQNNRRAQREK